MLRYTCVIAKWHQIELKLKVGLLSTLTANHIGKQKIETIQNDDSCDASENLRCTYISVETNWCGETKQNLKPNGV